jgi:predicted dehydrogenase/aryl-alcohol dehydrogenase-like predicted oxidoreductase
MPKRVRWGILGTGAIAQCFADNLKPSRNGMLQAVGSRSAQGAAKFAVRYVTESHSPTAHASYEQLLADKNVDAIYVCTPHPWHAEWSIKAVRAGKHVMCEKPFTLNQPQAMAVLQEAAENNVTVMEAFQWRCHPQTAKLVELIREKVIGDVQLIQAAFSFSCGYGADSRLWNNALAGGGILDVGSYAVAAARLIAGAAVGKNFADPEHVHGYAHLAPTGVDAYAIGSMKFKGGILAQVTTGVAMNTENVIRIFGTQGNIFIPDPWVCDRHHAQTGKIIVHANGTSQEILIPTDVTSFTHEINVFGDAVMSKNMQTPAPSMTWDDTLSQMRTLDRWRQAAGVVYEQETLKAYPPVTVSGGTPAVVRQGSAMKYLSIPKLQKRVSRLIMGCDNQSTLASMTVMNDDFFERGGNAFDTAFIYGSGHQERLLGQWIKLRNVREQVAVIVKGCHTPEADPISLTRQLNISLDRLQTDYADIYMMHRDNPEIPVGEFVDVMNQHVKAGRIKVFGGSNWSLARVDEANEYARKNGLQGFGVVSNNFSLARMVNPVWAGCVAASDADSRAWFARTQTTLLSWSSQARGFFVPGIAAPDKTDDQELVHSWYSDDNFRRLERAKEIALKHKVSPINIALAYVLCQPFPTIALIGPRQLSELRSSLPGLTVELSAEEVKYLNLDA